MIRLENEDGEDVMRSGWCYGECERTGAKGDFPAECVYVLPAITKPPPEVLVCLYVCLCVRHMCVRVCLRWMCMHVCIIPSRQCLQNNLQKEQSTSLPQPSPPCNQRNHKTRENPTPSSSLPSTTSAHHPNVLSLVRCPGEPSDEGTPMNSGLSLG